MSLCLLHLGQGAPTFGIKPFSTLTIVGILGSVLDVTGMAMRDLTIGSCLLNKNSATILFHPSSSSMVGPLIKKGHYIFSLMFPIQKV